MSDDTSDDDFTVKDLMDSTRTVMDYFEGMQMLVGTPGGPVLDVEFVNAQREMNRKIVVHLGMLSTIVARLAADD